MGRSTIPRGGHALCLPRTGLDEPGKEPNASARFACSVVFIRLSWADGGYAGQLVQWTLQSLRCVLETVKHSDTLAKFVVLPRRWVVERTFGWLGRYRRLIRDYAHRADVVEEMVCLAMSRLMLYRWVKH